MSEEPQRYTFIFTPPEEDAGCWNLNLQSFSQALNETFPDSSSSQEEGALGPRRAQSLSFELELMPNEWLEGIVSTPFPQTGSVVLELATPVQGAAFAKWLRDAYVPPSAPIEVIIGLALENGVEDVRTVPPTGDLSSIVRELEEHIALVEEETRS
ncbi:hypothetical protein ACQEU8_33470 [Streptomyces sp. CA-250714]|uniref:hypothetical protein n=1 Tax=Streptomyces sp. CA-250714 TaxID=3240060 RepID=UPI003D8E6030